MMMMRVSSVVVVSFLLLYFELLELLPCNQLVSLVLDGLEGGEGDVFSVLAFHVVFLSLCSLNVHLHGDLLGFGVLILNDNDAGVE